jgi:hypothetical protein
MDVMGLALLAVLVVLGGRWLYERQPARRERNQIKELMLLCDGDEELVQRLVFRELEREPELSMGQAARLAARRLRRDRR